MHQIEIDNAILRTLLRLDECKRAATIAPNLGPDGIKGCMRGADSVRRIKAQLLAELQQQLDWEPTA